VRHLYLSPHLDDAVLSCGGAIHRSRAGDEPVLAVTVFAGDATPGGELSPFALEQHEHWGDPPRPAALRRAEDLAALTLLDAELRHLDYLDAVYRAGADGEWLYANEEALWGKVHPADPMGGDGVEALADRLAGLMPTATPVVVYAPLGVGRHVDHQIVHAAARRLLARGCRVAFYEDYPYAEKPGAVEAALDAAGARGWRVEPIPLDARDLIAKIAALAYYRSQICVLFEGFDAMPNRLWSFAASRSPEDGLAERIWWPEKA
jgi:LmbE family N-acetylglucosaminyl deacetylase